MFLKLGHFRILNGHISGTLEVIFREIAAQFLIGPTAYAEDGKRGGYLVVVSQFLIGIESLLVFFSCVLLIKSGFGQLGQMLFQIKI